MRDIAAAAGCSLGLTYRYFDRKEELVLALYQQLAQELERQVQTFPRTSLAERFEQAVRAKMELIAPYREAFGALFGAALTPHSEVAVLGDRTVEVRQRVRTVFIMVIAEATDAPRPPQMAQLGTVLYAAHLGLLLFWFHDRSPDYRATAELLGFARDTLALLRPALVLPPVAKALTRLAQAMGPMMGAE